MRKQPFKVRNQISSEHTQLLIAKQPSVKQCSLYFITTGLNRKKLRSVTRDDGEAVGQGTVKELRAIETYKKQKNRYQLCLFCPATMLTSKIIAKIMENPSEFSGCAKTRNKFVSSRTL